MLTFIDVDYGANGAMRTYHHPALGIITVVTMYGRNGSADIVNLHGALEVAKGLLRFAAWEREREERQRRRRPRKRRGHTPERRTTERAQFGRDPKPAA
jgi:hypothetical protein